MVETLSETVGSIEATAFASALNTGTNWKSQLCSLVAHISGKSGPGEQAHPSTDNTWAVGVRLKQYGLETVWSDIVSGASSLFDERSTSIDRGRAAAQAFLEEIWMAWECLRAEESTCAPASTTLENFYRRALDDLGLVTRYTPNPLKWGDLRHELEDQKNETDPIWQSIFCSTVYSSFNQRLWVKSGQPLGRGASNGAT